MMNCRILLHKAELLLSLICPCAALAGGEEPCEIANSARQTDNFYFSASSAEGAVGDVVPVDISLTVDEWRDHDLFGFEMVCCFDQSKMELVGAPVFSEYYDELVYITWAANPVGGENPGENLPRHVSGQAGFLLDGAVVPSAAQALLSEGNPFQLLTLYFRILGTPGDGAEVRILRPRDHLPKRHVRDEIPSTMMRTQGRVLPAWKRSRNVTRVGVYKSCRGKRRRPRSHQCPRAHGCILKPPRHRQQRFALSCPGRSCAQDRTMCRWISLSH